LELVQGSLAGLSGDKTNAKELTGRRHEHINGLDNVHSEVLEEELVSLLLREVGPDRTEIDENGESLQVGNVGKRGGGGGGQVICLGGACTGNSDIIVTHAG
jgi:hypothetical protein